MKKALFNICLILFALPTWGQDLQKAINKFFPKQIEVYGVKIIGTENTPFNNIKKAANILNQWLDNNNDGNPDNYLVIDALIKNNAIADKRANTSSACPESPSIKWTNAKIIQTTNHTKINIFTDF